MLQHIKNIILFFVILFFIYVILLRETFHEGWARRQYENTKEGTKDAVDYAKDSSKAAYNNLADATTQIFEEVIGVVTGILGDALDSLASNVYRVDSIFYSIDNSLTNTSNKSANFEADVVNSIKNSTSYIARPDINQKFGGGGSKFGGGGGFASKLAKLQAQVQA